MHDYAEDAGVHGDEEPVGVLNGGCWGDDLASFGNAGLGVDGGWCILEVCVVEHLLEEVSLCLESIRRGLIDL